MCGNEAAIWHHVMNNRTETKKKTAIVTGPEGQLGPVWTEVLEGMGYDVFGIGLPMWDLSQPESITKAHAYYCAKYDAPPAVIVNSAAIDTPPGGECKFASNVEQIIKVNLVAPVLLVDCFIQDMINAGGGIIINVGSIMGNIGADSRNYPPGFEKPVGYNLSKAALIQYSRSLTTQYGQYGIRAVTIAFGPFDGGKLSPTFLDKFLKNVPLGRPISKESVKATLRYALTCPELSGQQILVDGGYTVL